MDGSGLDWPGVVSVVGTIVVVALTAYSVRWKRKRNGGETQASADASPGATVVSGSPQSTVVANSPGATVVQGDVTISMPGYSIEDHERIVGERERRLREELDSAHRADLDALIERIDALEEREFAPGAVRAVHAALSAKDYERAQSLLAAMEETEIQAQVQLGLGAQARVRMLRAETSLLSGDADGAVEHYESAANLLESFEPGQGPHLRNEAAQRLSSYAERFGGDGVARAIELYWTNLRHWTREEHPEEWAGTQRNLANSYIRLTQQSEEKRFRTSREGGDCVPSGAGGT